MHPGRRGRAADQPHSRASIGSRGSNGCSGCARPTARRDSSAPQISRRTAGGRMRSRFRSSRGSGNEIRTGTLYFVHCVQAPHTFPSPIGCKPLVLVLSSLRLARQHEPSGRRSFGGNCRLLGLPPEANFEEVQDARNFLYEVPGLFYVKVSSHLRCRTFMNAVDMLAVVRPRMASHSA